MSEYIKKLRIIDENGDPQDKQIDYNALANLPTSLPANGGHADSAERAEKDNSGNIITTTYATLNQLSQKADKVYVDNLFNSIVDGEEVYY